MALTTSPELLPIWTSWAASHAPGAAIHGLNAASADGTATVIVASSPPIDPDADDTPSLRAALAEALGVRRVEVIAVPPGPLPQLVKSWLFQAAQGTGRGIAVRVEDSTGDSAGGSTRDSTGDSTRDSAGDSTGGKPNAHDGPIDVQIWAIDSSARELVWRLASPHESGLPALRVLLGGREITIRDVENA